MREGDDDIEEAKKDDDDLDEMRYNRDEEDLEEAADEELEEATEDTVEESTDEIDEMGDMPMARDEDEMEMDMDMGAEEPAAGGMVSVDQLMSALEKALEDVLGQEVEVSQDDEEEMPMDDEPMDDMGEPALDLGMGAEEEEEEEELEEATPKTDVVEEVYARVIQRLTKETKSNKK